MTKQTEAKSKKPVMLCILDGWGMKTGKPGDTLSLAQTPVFDHLWQTMPHTTLTASGEAVGLPAGRMGNSEVGHLNIGAGRVVYQDFTRINKAIADGDYFTNPAFLQTMQTVKQNGSKLHLLGLLSDGGVHSHIQHLQALLQLAKDQGLKEVFLHCFLDGRDVPPKSAAGYLKQLQDFLAEIQLGQIATVIGRFYAMDRDKRWPRVEAAWRAMTLGEGNKTTDYQQALADSYAQGLTDEFVKPIVVTNATGGFFGQVETGDGMIFYNFRADRAREITRAFTEPDFLEFPRPVFPQVAYCCMTEYDETFSLPVAFPKQELRQTLGEVLAAHGKRQLRIAETEKYAHVTFFFNGGVEEPNPLEDRILIPSPQVATYDLQPEMSAQAVTETVLEKIEKNYYDVIILNFANPDMVGHTGVLAAAKEAVETVDHCLGRIVKAILAVDGAMLITADHGNVEKMLDEDGQPVTAHTTSPVPCILVGAGGSLREGGALKDIAPTLLQLLKLPQPAEMTGQSLWQPEN